MTELERVSRALAGTYEIKREVGQGGMAVVYLAEDVKHQREVAVKVLRPDLAATLGPDRFLREVKIAARLHHPHILPLYDSGEAGGFLYYVMPYEPGPSLREKLSRDGELAIDEAVRLLREIADALAHAHTNGLIHRDIKPDNVMLSGRHALVTDFGVAKAVSEAKDSEGMTTAGVALGTPAYMAPEQAVADPQVDHRADIYAFGVMAYELLTGRPPFSGHNQAQVLAAHIADDPEPLSQLRSTVPPQLEALVMRCLEKRPSDRWQSAEELVRTLEMVATPSGGTTPVQGIAPARARRRGWMVAAAAVAMIGSMAAVGLLRETPAADIDADRVAVFPFSVTETATDGVDYLGEGLVHLLSTALDGAGDLRTVDPHSVLTAVGEAAIDAPRAERISRDLGAGTYVLGNVTQVGPDRVQLSASLYRPDGMEPITVSTSGTTNAALELTGDIARQLLAALPRGRAGRLDSLALLTTDSVEALKAYLRGMSHYRESNWTDAVSAFQTATEIDTTFALAHYMLTRSASWAERRDLARDAGSAALRFSDRLSPRHQWLLRASHAFQMGRAGEAEEYALEVTRNYPSDHDGWYLLGEIRLHMGMLLGRPWSTAVEPFNRAVRIDPTRGDAAQHAYDLALYQRDVDAVRRLLEVRGQQIGDDPDSAPWSWQSVVAVSEGDIPALIRALRRGQDWSEIGYGGWGYSIARFGAWWADYEAGHALGEAWLEGNPDAPPLERAWLLRITSEFSLGMGQRSAALREVELSARLQPAEAMLQYGVYAALGFPPISQAEMRVAHDSLQGWDPSAQRPCVDRDAAGFFCTHEGRYELFRQFLLGILEARLGEPEHALRRAAAIESFELTGSHPEIRHDLARGIRGLVAHLAGRNTEALEQLSGMSRAGDIIDVRASHLHRMLIPSFVQAEVYNELGMQDEAIRMYQVAGELTPPLKPGTDVRIGEIHEARGEIALAVERYGDFLEHWSDPDPEYQPLADDIRARVARLTGESAQ